MNCVRILVCVLLTLCFAAPAASAAELKLRGEYVLAPPEYSLEVWKRLLDRFEAEGKNFIYWWGSPFFHSRQYPDAIFYKGRASGYLSHDEIRHLIRYSQSKGIKFYMAVGGLAWLTVDTLAELYPETRAIGSGGMCPNNTKAREINVSWVEELYQEFPELDGIMVELRDEYGPCDCEICRTRVDQYGSTRYGQGELELLREMSRRVWKVKPAAEIVVCIGYSEHRSHRNDVAFYEGIRKLAEDRRWIWLEVRDKWTLPGEGGAERPLTYFSPRIVKWYQPEYHPIGELAEWVRRSSREGFEGVCLGREVGSWSSLFGIRQGNAYLADSFRKNLSLYVFSTMARNPTLTGAELKLRLAREFFGPRAGERDGEALVYLDNLALRAGLGIGPAGNYNLPASGKFRDLAERAASPVSATLTSQEWLEVFNNTRAALRAAVVEGPELRAIASRLRSRNATSGQGTARVAAAELVEREIEWLAGLLAISDADASLFLRAHDQAAAHVSSARRRVVATSEHSVTNSALNLFDGNPETNWICRNALPMPQSVTVELPAAAPIERVALSQSWKRPDYTTRRYRIEGSVDGYHFDTLAEGELPLESGATRSHVTGGRPARFVRIVVLSIHPNAPYSSPALSEVEIMAGGKPIREWLKQ